MKKSLVMLCTVSALFVTFSVYADPIVITFESVPYGQFESYTESDVTFTSAAFGGALSDWPWGVPNGTRGIWSAIFPSSGFYPIRADISGGATSVSVDIGDFAVFNDPDNLFLEIYNTSGESLGRVEFLTEANDGTMHTLTLSSPNISYAIFGASYAIWDGYHIEPCSSVFADNFTFTPVPEPATMLLLGTGLAGLAGFSRKFKKT